MAAAAIASGTAQSRVAVVVLGDIGRSPRMQYHAAALSDHGVHVDLIGYGGSPLLRALEESPRLTVHRLGNDLRPRRQPRRALFVFLAAYRAARQALQLSWVLLVSTARPTALLVQNPPALPTLPIAWAIASMRGVPLIIDWHNFGASVLALRLGARHPLVRAAGWLEAACGRRATAHLCVSRAMQAELSARWGIDAVVLYDRPAEQFCRAARHALPVPLPPELGDHNPGAAERPALLVSSTSWTADEDFTLLLDGLALYDAQRSHTPAARLPALLVVITGRGPLRDHFEEAFRRQNLSGVTVRSAWLSPDDYPHLLAAADLGLSVHRSSSAVDLPMKVVDMLGAGLPVCAFDYGACIRERMQPGVNGVLFGSAAELAAHLARLLGGFPDQADELKALRRRVAGETVCTWAEGWRREALPLFEQLGVRAART